MKHRKQKHYDKDNELEIILCIKKHIKRYYRRKTPARVVVHRSTLLYIIDVIQHQRNTIDQLLAVIGSNVCYCKKHASDIQSVVLSGKIDICPMCLQEKLDGQGEGV